MMASGMVLATSDAESLASALLEQDPPADTKAPPITAEMIRNASWIARVPLTDPQCERLAKDLSDKDPSIRALRSTESDENLPMAAVFMPWFFAAQSPEEALSPPSGGNAKTAEPKFELDDSAMPNFDGIESVAFWNVQQLASGLRKKWYTSRQMTEMYLQRLKKADTTLHCVVTYHEQCLEDADRADEELKKGHDRGILHGIPWGAKDIIAIPGMPTTWGAVDYANEERGPIATVAHKLQEAGAILLAKLSVGTLAWGDRWFREMTRNPWDPEKGSSGSSAGSASAVVAGLCGFAIGSETLGSIVSPCRTCCVTGLRPSFGRVSRFGCMTLGWSMDKIGPITRSVSDCGWILQTLVGADGRDPSVVDRPFAWSHDQLDVRGLKIGTRSRMRSEERDVVEALTNAGAIATELTFEPEPRMNALADAITIEAGTMHRALFEAASADEQVGQWGPSFREAAFCSAMDYVQSMRVRAELIRKTEQKLREVDLIVGDGDLTRMNLTGHPSLVTAFGYDEERKRPKTVVFTSKYFSEAMLLQVGTWLQKTLPPRQLPPLP